MANQINITPASQVATVEVSNRELSVNVQNSIKTVDVSIEARSNINIDITRSIAYTGVQKIIAGNNITIDPPSGIGNVTINGSGSVANANYASYAGEAFSVTGSNVVGPVANALTTMNLQGSPSTDAWTTESNIGLYSYSGVSKITGINELRIATQYLGPPNQGTYIWVFDQTGNLTLPGNTFAVKYANGSPVQLDGPVGNANYANFAGTAFNVSGSNVVGTVASAEQANIANIALVANFVYGSNVSGFVANAQHATVADSANAVDGANVEGSVAEADHAIISDEANIAFYVDGANVNGEVAHAAVANSVAVANVVGIGNIAVVNLDGNASNILNGVGSWIAVPDSENANYANFAGEAFSVSGANVVGEVANANYSTFAGTVLTNAQPNITSVGTLTSLEVSGAITPNANISYDLGNNTNRFRDLYLSGSTIYIGPQELSANSAGMTITGNIETTSNIVATKFYAGTGGDEFHGYGFTGAANSNTAICLTNDDEITIYNNAIETLTLYANNNSKFYGNLEASLYNGDGGGLSNIVGANVVGDVGGANHANVADLANSVAGANVSGEVANATYATTAGTAYSVDVANVVGIGNIAVINLDGNSGNILYGNGVFSAVPDVGNANNANFANYANFAGEAFSVSGANVVGEVAYAAVANSVAGANISGEVANANYATYAGTAYSVSGANVTSEVANANYSTFSGIAYSVSGANVSGEVAYAAVANSVAGANVSGEVATANYATYAGTAYSVSGANVTSEVANANYATFAGTAYSVSGANVVGEVANANYSTFSGIAYSVSGSNVSGEVAFAAVANSVAGANVSGDVAGANHANVADLANSVSGSNVVGEVANANYATYSGSSFSVSGANVFGTVANATHAIHADEANSVSGSNVIGQVGNALIAGTVYSNAQPNITSLGTLTSLTVDGNITGQANITGDYFLGNGAFLTGVGDFSAAQGYWGSFYSNVSQSANSNTAAFSVTLNNSDPDSFGVFISNSSRVNFTYAGTYNLQFSLQFVNTNGSTVESSVWLNKNGNIVPDTRGAVAVTDKQAGVNGQIISAWNYILKLNAGDYLELKWQTEDYTAVSIEYLPAGTTPTTPASPSAIVTAMQVTNVQAATLGGDLTANLIGNSFGLTGTSFIDIIGNITGGHFTGNGSGITYLVGGNVVGAVANATHATISDASNVAYSVSGANVVGTVANATHATISDAANSVTGSNVIGAVGLATFATTANAVAGANVSGVVANATHAVSSDSANAVAGANVSGAVNLATFATTANAVAGANVSGTVANAIHATISDAANSVTGSNVVGAVGLATFATTANAVAGANVSGTVANATHATTSDSANSVAGSNVSGAVNLATFATTANAVAGANVSGVVANATHSIHADEANSVTGSNVVGAVGLATFATTANAVAGANVSGAVGLATFATTANAVAGANVSGEVSFAAVANSVAVANVSGIGNIAVVNLDGSSSNVLYGNGVFATISIPSGTSISNGTSNVNIPAVNGNVNISSAGNANVMVVTGTGANINGTVQATRFISNIATGTAPFTVTSTTEVANLNVAQANIATNIVPIASSDTSNQQVYFGTNANGQIKYDTSFNYNPSSNTLNVGNFITFGSNITGQRFISNIATGNAPFVVTSTTQVANLNVAQANIATNIVPVADTANATNQQVYFGANANGQVKYDPSFFYNSNTNTLNVGNFITFGSNITGPQFVSNIATGTAPLVVSSTTQVANLNVARAGVADSANAVAVANVTGIGNIATTNYNGNGSTVLAGNGAWIAQSGGGGTPGGSNTFVQFNDGSTFGGNSQFTYDKVTNTLIVGNITANGAGLSSIAGSNVSGPVAYATIANAVAGANVSGYVANADHAIVADSANSVTGANVAGDVTSAITAQTVTTNAQPNITSVGTLTSLNVGASVTASTFVSNIAIGTAPFTVTSTTQVANLSVATAGSATTAGTVTTNAQPNITSVGTLTSLNVSGVSNLNSVSNVIITGGTGGYVLSTNGSGNLSWVAQSGGGGGGETDFTPSFLLGGM